MKIKYLTEAHRKNSESAMKKISEQKYPVDLQNGLRMQDESLKRIMEDEERKLSVEVTNAHSTDQSNTFSKELL